MDVNPELQAAYDVLQEYDEATLRTLFSTKGLLAAFEAKGHQWSRSKRLYHAVLTARRDGILDDLLASITDVSFSDKPHTAIEATTPQDSSGTPAVPAGEPESRKSVERSTSTGQPTTEWDKREVYLIHGRDLEAMNALMKFLRKLNLRPVTWEDRAATGAYSGPMLYEVFRDIPVVIVLLTPDEEVRLHEQLAPSPSSDEVQFRLQPRPNVLLEAGMALASEKHKTVFVKVGPLRGISGLTGSFIIDLNQADTALVRLAGALQKSGCDIDDSSSSTYDPTLFQSLAARSRTVDRSGTAYPEGTRTNSEALDPSPGTGSVPPREK